MFVHVAFAVEFVDIEQSVVEIDVFAVVVVVAAAVSVVTFADVEAIVVVAHSQVDVADISDVPLCIVAMCLSEISVGFTPGLLLRVCL